MASESNYKVNHKNEKFWIMWGNKNRHPFFGIAAMK